VKFKFGYDINFLVSDIEEILFITCSFKKLLIIAISVANILLYDNFLKLMKQKMNLCIYFFQNVKKNLNRCAVKYIFRIFLFVRNNKRSNQVLFKCQMYLQWTFN
jgi:hypothetical protein